MFLPEFVLLLAVCGALLWRYREGGGDPSNNNANATNANASGNQAFRKFRSNYLLVYWAVMMGDWLQGPYVYPLYKSYGYGLQEIGLLFIVGFLSSAVLGTVVSSLADSVGRKRMCMAFAVIYIVSCLTKLSSNFSVLMLGRLTGGVSTSLLFSVFEAWMVSHHYSRGFHQDLLSTTFAWATFGNGLVAIGSGVMANAMVDWTGALVAPFMMAIVFLVIGGLVVGSTWDENYGDRESKDSLALGKALASIWADKRVLATGLVVSLFEGSMYTFVFEWGPVLEKNGDSAGSDLKPGEDIPYGVIFASFMVCIMIGSILFRVATQQYHYSCERLAQPLLLVASGALMIPVVSQSRTLNFWSFNLFELCCGVYFPMAGMLRSKYVPEETRATVMNIFRIPLNLIVVIVLTNVATWSHQLIFFIISALVLTAYGAATYLVKHAHEETDHNSGSKSPTIASGGH